MTCNMFLRRRLTDPWYELGSPGSLLCVHRKGSGEVPHPCTAPLRISGSDPAKSKLKSATIANLSLGSGLHKKEIFNGRLSGIGIILVMPPSGTGLNPGFC